MSVVVVGDVVTDVLAVLAAPLAPGSDTPAAVRLTGGGQAANTAAWLAWHGVPVTLVAAVGDDEAGRARLAELRAVGVTCAVRVRTREATGIILVLSYGSDRTMITDRGANLRLSAEDIDAGLTAAPDGRHLHLSAYTLLDAGSRGAGLRALAAARERGWTTSVDAASAAPLRTAAGFLGWVRGVDILLANADEAAVLAGPGGPVEHARALAGAAGAAIVKRGAGGAVWASAGGVVEVPAVPPESIVDPTGAGDAFAAGLLSAWLAGAGPDAALRSGAAAGARAIALAGARPDGRPTARDR